MLAPLVPFMLAGRWVAAVAEGGSNGRMIFWKGELRINDIFLARIGVTSLEVSYHIIKFVVYSNSYVK
jgi:hypothetical protein